MPQYLVCASFYEARHEELRARQIEAPSPYEAVVMACMDALVTSVRSLAVQYLREDGYTVIVLTLPDLRQLLWSEIEFPWDVRYRLEKRIKEYEEALASISPFVESLRTLDATLPSLVNLDEVTAKANDQLHLMRQEHAALCKQIEREESHAAEVEGDRCIDVTGQVAKEA